ncbi:MAG: DUF177 domain-containing protein [Burkholderiales bacterium]|nr:DUF177 domain-containing protein [Burkholderiales bacterium]
MSERSGVIVYTLAGSMNDQSKPVLDVAVEGALALTCQRCLERLDYDLRRRSRFVLVSSADALPDVGAEDPASETMAVDAVSDVADVVEQEVLLALPIAPMHAAGGCRANSEPSPEPTPSPFAVLGKLKKRAAGCRGEHD